MMTRAEQCGLRFSTVDREWWREHENVHDKLYNSRAGLSVYYRYKPRDIAGICRDHHAEPRIHFTAIERVAQATDGYAPGNLPKNLRVVTTGPVPQDSRLAELAQLFAPPLVKACRCLTASAAGCWPGATLITLSWRFPAPPCT